MISLKFEEVTFVAQKSTHTFYVDGTCHFDSTRKRDVQLIRLSLSESIKLHEAIMEIEVNGIVFECMSITVNAREIIGTIKRITSHLYTKEIDEKAL